MTRFPPTSAEPSDRVRFTSPALPWRQQADQRLAAHESVSVYASLRKLQLRNRLRHLKLANVSVLALNGYALVSVIACTLVGTAEWQHGCATPRGVGHGLDGGTWWLVRRQRRVMQQEYHPARGLGWTTDQLPAVQAVGL